jgi:Transcriptional regulator, AbiEi antitoxin
MVLARSPTTRSPAPTRATSEKLHHTEKITDAAPRVAISPKLGQLLPAHPPVSLSTHRRSVGTTPEVDHDTCRVSVPLMCTLGHIATTRELAARAISGFRIRAAVESGRIIRVKRGVYACPHITPAASVAANIGGAVTCVSVLRDAGVWAGNSRLLHVQIPPDAARPSRGDVRVHWERPRFGMDSRVQVTRMQALWRAIHCLDEENAIAAMESAIHTRFLPLAQVKRIGVLAPRRLQPAARRLVPESGSGNETIVRRRIERVGYRGRGTGLRSGDGPWRSSCGRMPRARCRRPGMAWRRSICDRS